MTEENCGMCGTYEQIQDCGRCILYTTAHGMSIFYETDVYMYIVTCLL